MTLNEENRNALVTLRLEKAKKTLIEAKDNIEEIENIITKQ